MKVKLQLDELKVLADKARINAIKSKNKKLYEFEIIFGNAIGKYNELSWFNKLFSYNPDFRKKSFYAMGPTQFNWYRKHLELLRSCYNKNHVIRKTREIIKLPQEVKELELDVETYNEIIRFSKMSIDDSFLKNNDPLKIWSHL